VLSVVNLLSCNTVIFLFFFFQMFYLPLAFFVPPSVFLVHNQFNLLYQFWIHTEVFLWQIQPNILCHVPVLIVMTVERYGIWIMIYLRNKSWKPECVLSFNMGCRILVFYPKRYWGIKFTNILPTHVASVAIILCLLVLIARHIMPYY
jgi:hypothetical protein